MEAVSPLVLQLSGDLGHVWMGGLEAMLEDVMEAVSPLVLQLSGNLGHVWMGELEAMLEDVMEAVTPLVLQPSGDLGAAFPLQSLCDTPAATPTEGISRSKERQHLSSFCFPTFCTQLKMEMQFAGSYFYNSKGSEGRQKWNLCQEIIKMHTI